MREEIDRIVSKEVLKHIIQILNRTIGKSIIFDFGNMEIVHDGIDLERMIKALSINRQRFSALLSIGGNDSFSDCDEELKKLTHYIETNTSSLFLSDRDYVSDLVKINLLLLNFNLFYKPVVSIQEFLQSSKKEDYVFRGEKDIQWSLTPSIYRKNDLLSFPSGIIDFCDIDTVYDSLDYNEKYNCLFYPEKNNDAVKYSFYQQYASFSPLLDFTDNLEVASAFAGDNYDIDGCIYVLKKDQAVSNEGQWPEHIEITNYDHLLTNNDIINGKEVFYLTHCDFEFAFSLVNVGGNDVARALESNYILIQKATVVNHCLICPFQEKILQFLLVDHKTKREIMAINSLGVCKKELATDIKRAFSIPGIDNYLNLKLKLAPDVVYRENGDGDVILLKTDKAKTYNLTGSVAYLLNYFKTEYRSVQILIDSIKRDFVDVNLSNLLSVKETLKQLIDDEILLKRNELETDFTPQLILSKGRFYHAEELTNCAFELTYRCNEKCKYCYCVVDPKKRELTLEELKRIMDQLYDMNVLELTFTGGDLFVRSDAFEILGYAYKKGFAFNIFTNGTALTDSNLITIKSFHPKAIHFSLFSHIAEKHDDFTQVPGSFEKTIRVAEKCILLGIPTNIKFTVTSQNMDDVEGVLKLVEDLGATIQIATEVFSRNDGDSSTLQYSCYDQEKLFEVYDLEKKHIVVKCSEGHTDLQYYGDDDRICGAGDHAISINPYGEVYTCNALPISIGNVRQQNVYDIWTGSEELKKIRNIKWDMIQGCEECNNKNVCNFCLGNSYTQNDGVIKQYDNACFYMKTRLSYNQRKEELKDDI